MHASPIQASRAWTSRAWASRPSCAALTLVASTISVMTATPALSQARAAQTPAAAAAASPADSVARLVAEPAKLSLTVGQTAPLKVTAYDASGKALPNAPIRLTGPMRSIQFVNGRATALQAGTFDAVALVDGPAGPTATKLEIPVTIAPGSGRLEIGPAASPLYVGATIEHTVRGYDSTGKLMSGLSENPLANVTWRSSDSSVASVDRFGDLTGRRPGTVTLTVEASGLRATRTYTVTRNPVTRLELALPDKPIRTGDVLHLTAKATDANGRQVADAPVTWSYTYIPDDTLGRDYLGATARGGGAIIDDGKFVANLSGRFTILAQVGAMQARRSIQVVPRGVAHAVRITSRGPILNSHTSDLWPWTGKDGRDYCLVGSWGSDGWAYVFDITDLNAIKKTDSIQIDARFINDVTVSPDGRYGVLSREGASTRNNGVVILDLATPAHPTIASAFEGPLAAGVHNMFATNDHLFAIAGGQKYVIIDVRDIRSPKYVSEFEYPSAGIHDIWVRDGIAYSSQWGPGTVVVDVGNGKYGGTIEKPKLITVFPIQSGHEIFPYYQKSTGKTYLFIGDEQMDREGRVWAGTDYESSMFESGGIAQTSGGYTHIVDFTDPEHPKQVARYQIEEFGVHDIIVQDDVLYQAFYDGGVRMVDVSGELMGNLYDQGRELGVFKPFDPKGFTANAPFVMNAMPWKGHTLFTDFNTGLWALKMEPK